MRQEAPMTREARWIRWCKKLSYLPSYILFPAEQWEEYAQSRRAARLMARRRRSLSLLRYAFRP